MWNEWQTRQSLIWACAVGSVLSVPSRPPSAVMSESDCESKGRSFFHWNLIMKTFLPPFSPFCWFKKGRTLSVAGERIDNVLVNCLGRLPRNSVARLTDHARNDLKCVEGPQNTYTTTIEPRHDKTNKMSVHRAKTQISLGFLPVWSESSLCAQWEAKNPSFLHADSEDSDQTGWMPRLIWVFAGRTAILLVLSCRGSTVFWLVIPSTEFFIKVKLDNEALLPILCWLIDPEIELDSLSVCGHVETKWKVTEKFVYWLPSASVLMMLVRLSRVWGLLCLKMDKCQHDCSVVDWDVKL